jgi:antitoxin CptB
MTEYSKLRWRCRRGMKELDVLLEAYLERHYDAGSAEERRLFAELLELQDLQLCAYLFGRETPADSGIARLVSRISTSLRD